MGGVHLFYEIDYAYIFIMFLTALSSNDFLNESQVRFFIHIHTSICILCCYYCMCVYIRMTSLHVMAL